ncbi:MAG: type II pantothenate kinase, partial [Anaerobacillus sp.]
MTKVIGIDAGGTLIKTAHKIEGDYHFQTFLTSKLEDLAIWIKEFHPEAILMVTGGKQKAVAKLVDNSVEMINEFQAMANGIRTILKNNSIQLPEGFLIVNVGTGTSIHSMNDTSSDRLGGSGIGGGTLMGLAYLLTGHHDFEKIVELAEKGVRDGIDLKVKNIYDGEESPIDGNLTASNFGFLDQLKRRELREEDILACLVGMIAEALLMVAIPFARSIQSQTIVFIGSTFQSNPVFEQLVQQFD